MFQISIENKPVAIVKEIDGGTIIFEVSRKTEDNALKVADGSTSDVGNTSYDGNAMVQFPLVWIYRYEDDDYLYEIISDIQWDSNYKAYAHTNSNGDIRPYCYYSMFSTVSNSKLRSFAGTNLNKTKTLQELLTYAKNNGSGWNIAYWSLKELIRTLMYVMSKSCNAKKFGYGVRDRGESYLVSNGTLNTKGQFFSYPSSICNPAKVFHSECIIGQQWLFVAGANVRSGVLYLKMTNEGNGYNWNSTDYQNMGTLPASGGGNIQEMSCSEYGMVPKTLASGNSTYFALRYFSVSKQNGSNTYLESFNTSAADIRDAESHNVYIWYASANLSYV